MNWIRERLDRAFGTFSWWSKFPLCKLNLLYATVSDHEPIQLMLFDIPKSKKAFRFKFENMWLPEPLFVKETSDHWKNTPVNHLIPKLHSISQFIERWGHRFFNKFKEKLKLHKSIIDALKDLTDEASVKQYLHENEKLNELLMQEELYWKQRAKLFWLQEGDDNTRFFHASAFAKKKTNHISFLETEDGTRVEDTKGMCTILKEYFLKVFGDSNNTIMHENLFSPRTVTTEQNNRLTGEVTMAEFTNAIKQMHPFKTVGPDGLNPVFYQHFWNTM